MKNFLIKNWKNVVLGLLGIIFIYLLVRVLTPAKDMSELNKYKLEQLDKHINEMKELQKSLSDSIQAYENKIEQNNEIPNSSMEIYKQNCVTFALISHLYIN